VPRAQSVVGLLRHGRRYLTICRRPQRLQEYDAYLRAARAASYDLVSLEVWLRDPDRYAGRTVVLRHDVDFDAASAWRMSIVERRLGACATYYFRWATFSRRAIEAIRRNGSQVGLHYETLTRRAIEQDIRTPDGVTPAFLEVCRDELGTEIACFKALADGCASVCAHGDRRARLIGVTNNRLLQGESYVDYGIGLSADDPAAMRRIDCWVSDGDGGDTYWSAGVSFPEALATGHRCILLNVHPNHWGRGGRVVAKRLSAQFGYWTRHPTNWAWGNAEALAWQRYRAVWNVRQAEPVQQGS
jgi:hypothetical protein